MPKKVCPQCGKEYGVRKLVCDCGHDFSCKQKAHPLYPEPGGWVIDEIKGMPKMQPPEPLPSGPISVRQLKEQISYEGLGFCLHSYIPEDRIGDISLRKLWHEARLALQKIVDFLE